MPGDRHIDELTATALEALDELATLGSGTARHCAAILRGCRLAGREIDDSKAMQDVERLMRQGNPRNAISIVAGRLALVEGIPAESIARRLRRRRANKNGQPGLSVSDRS